MTFRYGVTILFGIMLVTIASIGTNAFAQETNQAELLYKEAGEHLKKGEYKQAIEIYNIILDEKPDNVSTLKMKAIAQGNLGYHKLSLIEFFKVLEINSQDVIALNGMGVGFGNLGEYHEARKYFTKSLKVDPDNNVTQNYLDFVNKVIQKYPYKPTEKPEITKTITSTTIIPKWIQNNAKWWSENKINDADFISGIEFLISDGIMKIPLDKLPEYGSNKIPTWVKINAGWWGNGKIEDSEFLSGIEYLIEHGIIMVNTSQYEQKIENEKNDSLRNFSGYIDRILKNVSDEKRYIEYPNPSGDVIKKFLRDYATWNFDQQASSGVKHFPDPESEVIDGMHVLTYKIYVNKQPTGLPLDHVNTLQDSMKFWENVVFNTNQGGKGKVKFVITNSKSEANVWVTWVVRNLGQGILGHATLGKGIVEAVLGDYNCGGNFQLYDVETVKNIMTHELGHTVGLGHTTNPNNIMYPSMKPSYAYCLLN